MPDIAASSPILLYSSAARLTSSIVGFLGPSRLGTSICVSGHVWHPMGSPSGFARSSRARAGPAETKPATAACFAVLFRNSLLVIADICPLQGGLQDTPEARPMRRMFASETTNPMSEQDRPG